MQQEPYRSAWRVFWITDNGSSHRGQTSIERLSKWYPNAIQVHTPFTSCKKMEQGFADLLAKAGKKSWVVYSKKTFCRSGTSFGVPGPLYPPNCDLQQPDKINRRGDLYLQKPEKDGRIEEMSLKADEFIRRFLLHVLPKKFMKIRYFGFMAHMNKGKYIPLLREYIDPKADLPVKREETTEKMMLRLTGRDINMCTQCQKGQMIVIGELPNLYRNTS